MRITTAGEELGPFPRLPESGPELFAFWKQHSSFGACERAIMDALAESGGADGPQLAAATGYEFSGGFRNSLSNLRTAGVIVGKNNERITLAEGIG
jgi:hypothetical protein